MNRSSANKLRTIGYAGPDVVTRELGVLAKDFLFRGSRSKKIDNQRYPNSMLSNAWASPTNAGVGANALQQLVVGHGNLDFGGTM